METTYTKLRHNLSSIMDRVANDGESIIVRRGRVRTVAIVRADELTGLIETAHLLRSPTNAHRLLKALGRAVRQASVRPSTQFRCSKS
jgi:antitoxin YefM